MQFALNRLDMASAMAFANSAARIEQLGWHYGLLPCNPLQVPDPYVCLALACQATTTLQLGTLLDTPVIRHPSALAGSIATVASLAPGRVQLGLGIGDTAVRFNALAPASVDNLQACTELVQALLAGEAVEVGATRPARLRHALDVPVWIAAQGPKTLRMAGQVADGVWLRVGRHPENLTQAWAAVCQGAQDAGRDIADIQLGLICHTAFSTNQQHALSMARAVAAGYYEYSPFLFDAPAIQWTGAPAQELRRHVYPDFHHHRDMVHAGEVVSFLPAAAADAFALYGDWPDICSQLQTVLEMDLPITVVLPHPIVEHGTSNDYIELASTHLLPNFV